MLVNPLYWSDRLGLEPYGGLSKDISNFITKLKSSGTSKVPPSNIKQYRTPSFLNDNDGVWLSPWGLTNFSSEEMVLAAEINASVVSSLGGGMAVQSCRAGIKRYAWKNKKEYAANLEKIKKATQQACVGLGFTAAFCRGETLDSLLNDLRITSQVSKESGLKGTTKTYVTK